jgi:hypothetical protein
MLEVGCTRRQETNDLAPMNRGRGVEFDRAVSGCGSAQPLPTRTVGETALTISATGPRSPLASRCVASPFAGLSIRVMAML